MSRIKGLVQKLKVGGLARRLETGVIDLREQLKAAGRVLVLLPGDSASRREAIKELDFISKSFPGCEIFLVSMPDDDVREAARREGFRCFSPHRVEIAWCGLPKRSFYNRVRNLRVRLAVDLDTQKSCFNAAVSMASGAPIRAGMFGLWGAPVHNLEIKSNEPEGERDRSRSVLNVLRSLKMTAHK